MGLSMAMVYDAQCNGEKAVIYVSFVVREW